jgi:HAD superfamily hydrolase (TIGR01490 family)
MNVPDLPTTRAAAFFDVDGTLVGRHIVHHYIYIRRRMLPALVRPLWTGAFYLKAPYYLMLDKLSRTRLNVVFYRNYAGLGSEAVRSFVQDNFEHVIRPHLFKEGFECVAEHRRAGRRVVLVTGSIDFIMAPLARFLDADEVLAPKLIERDGRFTGELDGPPVGSEEKARRISAYAKANGLHLASSFAYGDSIADLPMLQEVGHPHAINPDKSLEQAARRQGWPAQRWVQPMSNGDQIADCPGAPGRIAD